MIVVADTSVILNLSLVGQDELLSILFRDVFVPPAVRSEFDRLAVSDGRFGGVTFPSWIQVRQPNSIPEVIGRNTELDRGETEALALAVEMHAEAVLSTKRRDAKRLSNSA